MAYGRRRSAAQDPNSNPFFINLLNPLSFQAITILRWLYFMRCPGWLSGLFVCFDQAFGCGDGPGKGLHRSSSLRYWLSPGSSLALKPSVSTSILSRKHHHHSHAIPLSFPTFITTHRSHPFTVPNHTCFAHPPHLKASPIRFSLLFAFGQLELVPVLATLPLVEGGRDPNSPCLATPQPLISTNNHHGNSAPGILWFPEERPGFQASLSFDPGASRVVHIGHYHSSYLSD